MKMKDLVAKKTSEIEGSAVAVVAKMKVKKKTGDHGTGLFEKSKMDAFVTTGKHLNIAHWEWTPCIKKNGTESKFGTIRCMVCYSFKPIHLKSITKHAKTKKHMSNVIKAEKATEQRRKKVAYLQPSVDKIIMQTRKLSPEDK